ncbi:MAG: S4 domain-containing protein YaaA [Tissierellia bacterium]|nr:S4 domain-containing protein YaaA [Tissierellia bacterium]
MEEIKLDTDYIKLDQFLKFCGIAQTGGQAKMMVADGLVKVNGEVSRQRGKKIRKDDKIEVDEEHLFIVI